MAQEYEGKVRVVNEDFGASELAERFGVKRYPAVFVNDVLIAKPKDFGFYGTSGSQGAGRYTPWLKAESHELFRLDLERSIQLAMRDELEPADDMGDLQDEIVRLPEFESEDLDGIQWNTEALLETVTIVEFWATWCPPCLKSMPWLVSLQQQYPDALQIVSIAVESKPDDVRGVVQDRALCFPTLMGSPELVASFGDLTSVPTMFIFARGGRLVDVIYGAPPELHEMVERTIDKLLETGNGRGQ